MSKLFNAFYFSAENGYGCKETFLRNEEAGLNAAWEIYEAGQDLETGITENVPEFVWMEENKSSTAKK